MHRSFIVATVCCILAAGFAVAVPPESAQAEASFAPSSIALRSPVNGWASAYLVIAGPEGFRIERNYLPGETIAVDFSRLEDTNGDRVDYPDGRYKWELTLTAPMPGSTPRPGNNDAQGQAWLSSGSFLVQHGGLSAQPGEPTDTPTATATDTSQIGPVQAMTTNPYGNHFVGDLTATDGVCAGCTDGDVDPTIGDVVAKDGTPQLTIRDTTNDQLWRWETIPGGSMLRLIGARLNGTSAHSPVVVEADTPDNALYFDTTGQIGVLNSTPSAEIHVKTALGGSNGVPDMWFENPPGDKMGFLEGYYWFAVRSQLSGGAVTEPLRIYNGAPSYIIDVKQTGDLVLGGLFTNYAPVTVGYNTSATNSLVAPMIVTTYSTGTPANGFGAMTQWGLEAADGTLAVAADFGGLWENASAKDGYLIFRAAHNGAATEYLRIEGSTGYVGFQSANPAYPIHHGNGARLTTGGVWTDASSRAFKQDIETLDADAAMAAFKELTPVTYAYKADPTEHHAGFIAEDVPDLVASGDRTGLAPMDVVAVLTKVVQEQQKTMETQQKTIESQQAQLAELRSLVEKLAASR